MCNYILLAVTLSHIYYLGEIFSMQFFDMYFQLTGPVLDATDFQSALGLIFTKLRLAVVDDSINRY